MQPTRREAIGLTVAAISATNLPASVPLAAVIPADATPPVGASAFPNGGGWWAGRHQERFTFGPKATREELLRTVDMDLAEEGFHVVEAAKHEPTFRVEGRDVMRLVDHANRDILDPDDPRPSVFVRPPTQDQVDDLSASVEKAILAWRDRHGIETAGFLFAWENDGGYVPGVPESEECDKVA